MKHSLDKRRRPKRRPVAFESLEPRLLLSADLAPALAPFAHDALPPIPAEHRSLEAMAELPRVVMAQEAARASELVFVDSTLPDYERLVADVLRATGGERPVEVILLDPSRDGVAQMTEALAGRTGLTAVHVVTHGGDGQLQLGGATLDAAALEANTDAIAGWSRAFAADGDLLLYGCNVAETARGGAFIDALALLTGADVAASEDRTGAARLGGDWDLERTTGVIEMPLAARAEGDWAGLLTAQTLDWDAATVDWPAATTGSNAYAVGAGNVTITVADPFGLLNNGSPDDDTMNDQGGLGATEQGLYVSSTGFAAGESATITIDFSHPGGVSNVSFTIFDIDIANGAAGFVDEVQATYTASGATTLTITPGPSNQVIGGNTVQGTANSPSNGANSGNANATFTFTGTGITQIVLTYRNAGVVTGQSITLHDIHFTENSRPSGTDGGVTFNEDTTYSFVAANFGFTDPDAGDTLSAVRIDTLPAAGSLVLFGSGAVSAAQVITIADINAGNLRFTPAANANGAGYASFTFSVRDPGGLFDLTPNTLTINVTAVNDAPAATNDGYAVNEDATLNVPAAGVLANDTDVDGPALSAVLVAGPSNGSLTLNANGSFSYTPNANFNGSDSFTYRASDGSLLSNIGTVTITVTAVNDAPTFGALGNQTLAEDAPAQTLASFTTVAPGGGADEAAQTFSYTVTNDNNPLFAVQPSIAANGTLTYTLAPNAIGTATVTVSVTDSGGTANGGVDTTGPRTFTVTATPVADTPSVTNAATLEDTQTTSGLVIARNAVDGAEVTHYKITGIAGGTLFLNDGTTTVANGDFITAAQGLAGLKFTPSLNSVANGTFDLQASTAANDAGLGGSVVTATITVTPVNDAPSFAALANQTVAEDAGAQTLAGFTTVAPGGGADEVGQTFSYTVTNDNNALFTVQPTIDANGILTYTTAANLSGTATVTVFVTDSGGTANGATDTAGPRTFSISATPVADAPSVTNAATLEDTQSTGGLVITRNAADGAEVTHFKITGIAGGTLFLNDGVTAVANGTFLTAAQGAAGLKFTPAANSIASGAFDVQASTAANDTGLGGGVVTATITVTAVNDEPTVTLAGNQAAAEDAGAQAVAGFATAAPGGGADEAGQTFTYAVTNDNNALFTVQPTIAANGTLTYTSAPDANGIASITVTLSDSGGTANGGDDTAPAQTFTITVNAVNDAPVGSVSATLGAVAEDAANPAGATVAALFGANYSDTADGAGATALAGVAIVGNTAMAAQGVWQYSPDGLAWTTIGVALSDASAVTLPATHLIRFLPAADFNGTPGALSVRLADGSAGAIAVATGVNLGGAVGGTGNWSAATVALGTSITAVNDAPTFAALANQTLAEDAPAQTLASFTTVAPGGGADEAAQTFSYTVTNDNNPLFAVQPSIAANGTLTYTLAPNAIGTATVTVSVTDSGGTANGGVDTTGPRTFTVTATPVADTPSVTNAATLEDTQTTSGLVIARNAVDGAEVTHYKITGIAGGTLFLNDGTTTVANGDFITAAQGLAGLKFTPSLNSVANGTFDLQASTAANDAGLGGSVVTATITVTPVNDAPSFAALANQTVAEDAGAQTLAGFTTVAPGGGADEVGQTFSYTVTNDNNALFTVQPTIDANGILTYTTAANLSGTATVTVFVTDSGGTANGATDTAGPRTFSISATPVADAPTLTVNPATGNEDTAIALVVARSLVDTDGSESLALTVSAIPVGATLSDGVNTFTASLGNQSVAITTWNLAALRVTPPPNSDVDFALTVSATATEAANGATATTVANLAVTVDAVADAPTLTVNPATGNEDTAIALVVARSLVDTDGSESLALTVSAIPVGATLSDGVNTFTASLGNQSVAITTWNLAALRVTPPPNSDVDFALTVSATATEAANGATATTVANLAVTVDAVADAPTLTVNPATGNEDTAIALVVARSLVDTDGSESLALTVSAIPVGATLSDGVNTFTASLGNQSVAITTWNLAALRVTPPPNSDVDFALTVSATATEAANGATATTVANLSVTVDAVADAPTLTVNPATGNEDTAIALVVARSLVDTDGSESLALTVSAIPVGATLSDGVNTFTASLGNQSVAITTWNLAALRVTPPPNSDVDFALTVSATATEAANGATATTVANLSVTVDAVADAPTLTVNPATGNEDTAIALVVARSLVDTDGSESLALTVSAIPVGATLSDGVNTFTASLGNQSVAITTWNLAALRVTPPPNSDVDFALTVSATATEAANGATATTVANLSVTVDAVADAPTLTVNPATGNEDTAIALVVARSLVDTDGSESLALTVSAIPVGATLSDGVNTFTASLGNQSVAITTWNLAALRVTPPPNSDVDFALTVSATATEAANGATATTVANLAVTVDAVADAPTLTVNPATGNEDTAIALVVARSLVDTDGSESLALTVSAIPVGATLSDGVNTFTASLGNQSVAITTWNLAALRVTPPPNSDVDFALTVSATATEAANGATATTVANLAVTVDAVADAPTLTVNPATGNEDTAIALVVARSLVDTDGSESLALTVSAIPVGATLSDGVNTFTASLGNQSVAITTWNLAALRVTPPPNSDVDFALTVSATATEAANGATATTVANLGADVVPVNDAPVLGPVALSIDPLQTVTMAGGNMSATDVDDPSTSLVFLVAGATNGQFELAAAPGVRLTSFTQAQLASGAVRFVHTNAGFGPSFSIFVTDGTATAGPGVAIVSFRAPGAEPSAPAKQPEPARAPVVAGSEVLLTGGGGFGQPAATDFIRAPFAPSDTPAVIFAEAPAEATIVLARPVRAAALLDLRAGGAPGDGFVEAERIPTGLPKMDFAISAVRHDDSPPPLDIAFGSARITGMALSVGAVWWAARAGGLLASLLASTPAWRHVDPLPVLGRDDDEPEIDWNTPDKNPPDEEASEAAVFDEGRAAKEPS